MTKRLSQNLNSDFVAAANKLRGKHARHKIVAYVESYDDIFFWSNLLRQLETDKYAFEVMLPSRSSLSKGKKIAMSNHLGERLGEAMIACVDADYDYLMQGATENSRQVCTNPYVFHTYVYAIENFQCYAPALENVCVMCTLNDRDIFDFEVFLGDYSEAIWPLFVWNVWAYRYGVYQAFSMLDFYRIVSLERLDFHHPERTIETLRRRINAKISRLQRLFPQGRSTYKPLKEELLRLGVTPRTTYLYMRGHDLFDGIVTPLLAGVCESLRREREREIRNLAGHDVQMQNELAAYQHAVAPIEEMLRKHTGYMTAAAYQRIISDIRQLIGHLSATNNGTGAEREDIEE